MSGQDTKAGQRPTVVEGLTPIQRAAEVTRLNQYAAPLQVVIDPGLKPGQWYVVRALTKAERSVINNLITSTGVAA